MLLRQRVHAGVNLLHKLRLKLLRQRRCVTTRRRRRAGHRGDVAQAAGQRLAPDFFRRRFGGEMNALHHRVGLEQQQPVAHAHIQHGAIITRADHDGVIRRQRARQAGDEFKFVHGWAGSLRLKSSDRKNNPEVDRVEQAVRGDGREQVVRFFVEPGQHQRQQQQRQKDGEVEMDGGKKRRRAPQRQPGKTSRLMAG